MPLRSLEKRAVDELIQQLLGKIGDARVVGPNAPLTVLDAHYVGPLKALLAEAIPGIPDPLLTSVRDDLIVVRRAPPEPPSALVGFYKSYLRVASPHSEAVDRLRADYGAVLNVDIQRTRLVETDWRDPVLTFSDRWFARRSLKGWSKLSLHLARLCARAEELKKRTGLRQEDVFYSDRDGNLLSAQMVSARETFEY
jgi:hypothetical protein